ncbi:hypothetical protein [Nocardioides pacificus]
MTLTTRHTRTRAALTALVAGPASLLALTAGAAPAGAATTSIEDREGDAGADITKVRVGHAARLTVRVAHARPLSFDDRYTFWIHTGRSRETPTFRVSVVPNSGVIRLDRVSGYGGRGAQVACARLSAEADVYDDGDVVVRVPRACIGEPRRVAVVVRFLREGKGADWAPGWRIPSPWVRQG